MGQRVAWLVVNTQGGCAEEVHFTRREAIEGAGPEDEVGALDAAAEIRALASETEGK